MKAADAARRRLSARVFAGWLAYTAFVVYGSLVPLDYRPLAPGEAWTRFQQIPFLDLGAGSRADWIANGVLYAPLGFLTALALLVRGCWRVLALPLAVAFGCGLALAVEYAQLFFPPRTVSLNDLLAEAIGSVAGALAAAAVWGRRARWQRVPRAGASWLHAHALALYAAAYLAYSLFPYDLLLSAAELRDKLASDRWGWVLAGGEPRPLVTLLRLLAETLLSAPLGAWLAQRRIAGRSPPMPQRAGSPGSVRQADADAARAGMRAGSVALVGLVWGLAIEAAQLLIVSGVTQGASVLTRLVGVMLGAWAWPRRHAWPPERVRAAVARAASWAAAPYLLLLLGVNGWWTHAWGGAAGATTTLASLRWQPFYYHYYTSEAQALLSLTGVALAYAPIGLWAWARRRPAAAAALAAALACAVVEGGKLFLVGLRPDPTNLGIAAAAAALVAAAATRWQRRRATVAAADEEGPPAAAQPPQRVPRRMAAVVQAAQVSAGAPVSWPLAALALAALGWQLLSVPPGVAWTTLAVGIAEAAVAWRPAWSMVLIVAALPLFDFAPWTGRLLWDEFDLLLALALAVAWARTPAPSAPAPALWRLGFGLVALSAAVSAGIALWPIPPLDANALASYHHPFNALRIAKGLLWAALLAGLWRRLQAAGHEVAPLLARGMTLGLAGVVGWVLWERTVFVGWADLGADYRVTGPFSAMHRGGAFVECYLALGAVFAARALRVARGTVARAAALALLGAASLALMLTFSRNGYAALAAGLVVFALLELRARGPERGRAAAMLALAIAVAAAASWPVLRGGYAQERLAHWQRDLGQRSAHWQDALALRGDSWGTLLFGIGLGRFAQAHFWGSQEPRRAALLHVGSDAGDAGGGRWLRLGAGALTYLDQIVRPAAADPHVLTLRLRGRDPAPSLAVSVCQKWMLTSADCVRGVARSADAGAERWGRAELKLDLAPLRAAGAGRPIKFALHTPSAGEAVDVTDLSLRAPDGRELLRNGDFARGFDGWWMSTDIDPPYHVHSLPLAVLLEQGAFGAFAWALLLGSALAAGFAAAIQGRAGASSALAALVAFTVCASVNTLIDDPRFLLLLLLLAWAALAAQAPARSRAAAVGGG
ncbi:MAG: VanZ family protein [Burkholderiales bacterium]|nr:VanZ family protein [Burkholderiales bacterium]